MLKPTTPVGRPSTIRPALKPIPIRPWFCVVPKRRVPYPFQSPRLSQFCRVSQGAATPPGPAPAPPATDSNIKFKKGFWTFVDVIAILGSVGGALAAILNLISGTYVLFLPLVLPVISLLSALQREGLIAEDNRRAYDTLRVSLTHDSTALLADARGALEEVRRELRGQNTTAARLGTIEARLSSLEGSILSAGRSAREAAAGLGVLPERLQSEQRAVLEGLVGAMRLELRRAAEALANNETTALARLDARLAAVEGSLSGLEVAQSEGLRRLSMSLNSALADAEATLQSSVRNEVARSMEPVRRLPQMLAAALPPALAAAEAVEASAAGGPAGAVGGTAGSVAPPPPPPPPPPPVVTPEQLQAIVSQEVEMAAARILDFQADAFGRFNSVRPVPMDDEQWAALGRRLTRLERLVEGVPAGTEGALLQGGQVPAAVAAAVGEALAMQVAEARTEMTAAVAREVDSVRNDILAAQTVLRESLDGLAAALQPLQLGVTELQVAVAAVSNGQQEQLQLAKQAAAQTAATAAADVDSVAAAAPPPPPPAELARLLEGVEAVARLLRNVDMKMDGVTAAMAQLPTAAAAAAAAAAPPSSSSPSSPPPPPKSSSPPDFTAEAVAAAAARQQQQQWELQNSMESMKEALAALTSQISLMAAQGQLAAAGAPESAAEPSATTGSGGGGVVADVLSFEASLTSGAPSPPELGGGSGEADGGRMTSTAGVTRDEAYDMMLQLAEARRRSGSEASSSGSSGVGDGGTSGDGGSAAATAAARPAESQLRIVGLPPFEGTLSDGATATGATAAGSAAELQPLPPSQRVEQEVQQLQQQQQQLQQQLREQQQLQQLQQYPDAATWQQQQLQPDMRSTPAASTALPPQPPPVTPSVSVFDGSMAPPVVDAPQPPSYGGLVSLPYEPPPLQQQQQPTSVYQAPPASPPSPPSPSPNSYVPFAQGQPAPGPAPAYPPPAQAGFDGSPGAGDYPTSAFSGYAPPQGETYGWDPRLQQQQQPPPPPPPAQRLGMSSPYDQQQQQPVQDGGFQEGGLYGEGYGGSYSPSSAPLPQAPPSPPVPSSSPSPKWAGGAQAEQPSEKPSWYGMIQQFTAPLPPPVQPSQAPSPSQPQQQQQQQQQQKQQPRLRLPFWPPQPPQQPQTPLPQPQPRSTAYPTQPPPQQQQQQQQPQQAVRGNSLPPSPPPLAAAAAATAAPPSPAPLLESYRPRPLDGLSGNELISEGLRLLRLGREETRKGEDYGLADSLIQSAIAAFTRAAELPSAAADAKALGNLGNALLARGELKAAYLEALRSGPPPSSPAEAATQMDAERAMTGEANALLTDAGIMFLKVLELEGWSSRALVNWGRALVIRADLLAATPDGLTPGGPTMPVVTQLYTSAIDKFEGVLEGEPGMVPAKYRCALALAGLSRTKPPGSRDRLTLLADAINYLRDVVASTSPDAEALRPSAMTALQQYEAQLMTQRAVGRQ